MSAQKILYVFRHAPYSTAAGLEGLDAVLVGAAFECDISLLFLDDGVFQLKRQQDLAATPMKQYTKTFLALEDFDVNSIYVHEQSMVARGLTPKQLMLTTESLASEQVSVLIAGQDKVFTF